MGQIPITIQKIKLVNNLRRLNSSLIEDSDTIAYLFKVEEKGLKWQNTYTCSRFELF